MVSSSSIIVSVGIGVGLNFLIDLLFLANCLMVWGIGLPLVRCM